MQLGGSLMLTFTVPIPETMLLEEPPLQLTMIPATAKIANAASRNVPARELRAIHSDFIALLLKDVVFRALIRRKGTRDRRFSRPWLGRRGHERAGRSQPAEL